MSRGSLTENEKMRRQNFTNPTVKGVILSQLLEVLSTRWAGTRGAVKMAYAKESRNIVTCMQFWKIHMFFNYAIIESHPKILSNSLMSTHIHSYSLSSISNKYIKSWPDENWIMVKTYRSFWLYLPPKIATSVAETQHDVAESSTYFYLEHISVTWQRWPGKEWASQRHKWRHIASSSSLVPSKFPKFEPR